MVDINQLFKLALEMESERATKATGSTPEDFLYDQAESAQKALIDGYAYVTYKGERYGPDRITWGALDGDKNKKTVLVRTKDAKWVKLWFFEKELLPPL